MPTLVNLEEVRRALVRAGQFSTRYNLGDKWELNGEEIEDALKEVNPIDIDLNELCRDMADSEKETEYWRNLAKSYEETLVKLCEVIAKKGEGIATRKSRS